MADMTTIKGRIQETIYPNGTGAITAESHQALLLEMVDDINAKKADKEEITAVAESVSTLSQEVESNYNNFTESLDALEQKVDNLPQGEAFDKEGNYPLLHVGTADTAIDLAGRGESVPASFGFRASGGKSIKDGRAYIKAIKGNSVVWNSIFKAYTPSVGTNVLNGVTYTLTADGEVTAEGTAEGSSAVCVLTGVALVKGHRYLVIAPSVNTQWGSVGMYFNGYTTEGNNSSVVNGRSIFTATDTHTANMVLTAWAGNAISIKTRVHIHDLTQMFGAGNEPTTIEEFYARKPIVEDLYAYNEGQVIHCNTESIKSVGDNAWDEQWEVGGISTTTGAVISSNTQIRSKNYCDILGGYQYAIYCPSVTDVQSRIVLYDKDYNLVDFWGFMATSPRVLSIPDNVRFFKIAMANSYGTTYNHDIMITLVHSGWKQDTDAGYQPYWQDILPLPIIRKYFPNGMKSAGSAHDEIRFNKASGKWEYSKGKIKSVDLGTLNWIKVWYTEEEGYRLYCDFPSKAIGRDNIICGRYVTQYITKTEGDMGIDGNPVNTMIYIKDTSFATQGADALIASLQGVMLYYESNDWEWVELDAEDQNFRNYYQVADFGTEQSQSSVPSAAFSADIIYQFNAVDMIREHELEITELQNIIATMQAQLTSLINGGQ